MRRPLKVFPHYKSMEAMDLQVVASLNPIDLIGRIYVEDHYTSYYILNICTVGLMVSKDF